MSLIICSAAVKCAAYMRMEGRVGCLHSTPHEEKAADNCNVRCVPELVDPSLVGQGFPGAGATCVRHEEEADGS